MYACHIQHNKLQVNTSFLSPNQSVNDVFIFSVRHQVCNQLYSRFSQAKLMPLWSSGRASFRQKRLDMWGQEHSWSNPFLQFTSFYSSSSLQYYHRLHHHLHLKKIYYIASAPVGETLTGKMLFPVCYGWVCKLGRCVGETPWALKLDKTGLDSVSSPNIWPC